jgi:hypothetical protein
MEGTLEEMKETSLQDNPDPKDYLQFRVDINVKDKVRHLDNQNTKNIS